MTNTKIFANEILSDEQLVQRERRRPENQTGWFPKSFQENFRSLSHDNKVVQKEQ